MTELEAENIAQSCFDRSWRDGQTLTRVELACVILWRRSRAMEWASRHPIKAWWRRLRSK